MLHLHNVPRLFGHLAHLGDDAQLLVQHQQRVVAVGNAPDDLCADGHLVVLEAQQLHLRGTLLREDVAKEVQRPRCSQRELVRLGCRRRVGIYRVDASHLGLGATKGDGRQESQLGSLQHGLIHLYRQDSILQVGILLQSLLNECLQLRVSEYGTPRQVAEGGSILWRHEQGVRVAYGIAYQSLGVHLRTLVLVIYAAAAHQQACDS